MTQLTLPLGKGQSSSWRHRGDWGQGMRGPTMPKQGCREVCYSQGLFLCKGMIGALRVMSCLLCWPGQDGKAHVSLSSQSEAGLLSPL